YSYAKPESVKLLTADEIYENYKKTENIGLYYNIFYDSETDERYVKPVYIIKPKNINASTGEEVTAQSQDDYIENEEALAEAADTDEGAGASKRVTAYEKNAIKDFEKLITKEAADDTVKKYFPQVKNHTVENSNIITYGDYPQISLSYKGSNENESYANASLNAQTGEILGFSNYKYGDRDKYIDIKKVEPITDELFKNIVPEIYKSGDFKKETSADNSTVTYQRTHDGIKVNGQSVSISCNYDYTIRDYRKNWDKLDFPSAKNAVAERSVFESSKAEGFGLKYIITDNAAVLSYGYMSGGGYFRYWRNDSYYDALTGEKIDPYTGALQINNEYGVYTDLEGSPYKEIIETLAEYGYTLPYTEFKPNELITIEDFYYFADTNIIYISDKRYYGEHELYSEEEAKKPLTKYDIAKIFVNESGYTELAKKDIFKTEFTDVSAENTGVVAIASAMGFIPEKGGEFNGAKQITRGEAAEYIYKCLQANNAL
ncbi:MAG: S-layer homology domain-containing protein, partial [Firmicutes bacterium]|nr:S-layer homology domain-containing protein [Bacillota bacterium]